MKTILALSLFASVSAFADFSDEHKSLCSSKANCQLVLAPVEVVEMGRTCRGKLSDINCKVMMLKTSDSASMNLICGEAESPILTQVLNAEVISYNVSAVSDSSVTSDPNLYHLFSHPALDVHLTVGESTKAKMILSLQDRSIALSNVTCD